MSHIKAPILWQKILCRILVILIVLIVFLTAVFAIITQINTYITDRKINKSEDAVTSHIPSDWVKTARYKRGGYSDSALRTHIVEYSGEWSIKKAKAILEESGGQVFICRENPTNDDCTARVGDYCAEFTKTYGPKIQLAVGSKYCHKI